MRSESASGESNLCGHESAAISTLEQSIFEAVCTREAAALDHHRVYRLVSKCCIWSVYPGHRRDSPLASFQSHKCSGRVFLGSRPCFAEPL